MTPTGDDNENREIVQRREVLSLSWGRGRGEGGCRLFSRPYPKRLYFVQFPIFRPLNQMQQIAFAILEE